MYRNRFSGVVLLVSFALAGLLIESPALARQLIRRVNKGPAKALATTEVINTLKSAERLLVTADHDYDGHRALAAEEVHRALAELGHRHANLAGAGAEEPRLPDKRRASSRRRIPTPSCARPSNSCKEPWPISAPDTPRPPAT